MPSDMAERKYFDNPAAYNVRALVRCEATYLGAALPTRTTQPPGIIHEPLEKICERESLPSLTNTPKKPVMLYIFHSGVLIELLFGKHSGEAVWYPIQNLYCSAGLQPLKTKNGKMEFYSLDEKAGGKSTLKPIFAMVIRETVQKKVLQCHAFAVTRKEIAQLLVQATALAYRDEAGWNQPLHSLNFRNIKCGYTLNIADDTHTDSGYSDHDECSLKGGQSPRSSELSTDNSLEGYMLDNHTSALARHPYGMNIKVSKNETISSKTGASLQSSPKSSQTSASGSEFQSDLLSANSEDEEDSTLSNKSTSISSGYPLSRDSSLATADCDITPTATIVHRVNPPLSRSRHQIGNQNSLHTNGKIINMAPLESLKSLSLSQSTLNSYNSDRRYQKVRITPTAESRNAHCIPRQVVYSQAPTGSTLSDGRVERQYYMRQQPLYTQYHPDQFMYRSDSNLANHAYVDPSPSWSKERTKSASKESKKVRISTFFTKLHEVHFDLSFLSLKQEFLFQRITSFYQYRIK